MAQGPRGRRDPQRPERAWTTQLCATEVLAGAVVGGAAGAMAGLQGLLSGAVLGAALGLATTRIFRTTAANRCGSRTNATAERSREG